MVSYLNPALAGASWCFAVDANSLVHSLSLIHSNPDVRLRSLRLWTRLRSSSPNGDCYVSYAHSYHCAHTHNSACILRPQRTSQNHCCQPTRFARGTLRVCATLCRIIRYVPIILCTYATHCRTHAHLTTSGRSASLPLDSLNLRLPLGYAMTLSHCFATRTNRFGLPWF